MNNKDLLDKLVDFAIRNGAAKASPIKVSDIVIDERVRLKCMVPRCSHYGELMCPPNLPSIDEVRKIVSRYRSAMVLSIEHENPSRPQDLQDFSSVEQEFHNKAKELSDILLKLEGEALDRGYRFAAGFTAGSCAYCDECVGTGEKCRHPFNARPSMEGMGIDVVGTLENIGIKLEFPVTDKMDLWGLILVD